MKILFGIAVYISNDIQLEFTEQTVQSIQTKYPYEVVLVNNYCAPEYREQLDLLGKVIPNTKNCVSSAWNRILDYAKSESFDFVICPNNDIIFHPQAVDNLIAFAQSHPEYVMWTAAQYGDLRTIKTTEPTDSFDEHPHFSCWMVKPEFVGLLKSREEGTTEPFPGYFDENFEPAYFEDVDMHNRILRAGWKAGKTASALFYHFGSRTIKTDIDLEMQNNHTHQENKAYCRRKWGFDPQTFADENGRGIENDDPIRFAYKAPFEKGDA